MPIEQGGSPPVLDPATESKQDEIIENQTDGSQKTSIVDKRGEDIETDNPFAIRDVDDANRLSQNTVFGEKIQGIRKPTIAAQFQYGISSDGATITNANGGQSIIEDSLLKVSTGTNVAGSSIIQTTNFLRYIPGHEGYMYFTAVFTEGVADSYQRAGLYDSDNGFFIGYEGADFKITRRRDGVDTSITIDVDEVFEIDTFDPAKGNVYKISFGYLGFAAITFEIMSKKGTWRELGKFEYPNSATVTHILQTYLPARAETANTGNNTNLEMRSGSFSVGIVDGGGTDPGARLFSASVPTTTISAGNFLVAMFRNKATFNSIENRVKATLMLISTATDLSKISSWKLLRNATITNTPTWTDVNTTDSIMEYSVDATIDFNTGDDLIPWSLAKVDSFFEQIEQQLIDLKPGETSSVVVTTPVGTTGSVETSFRWKELF